MTPEQIQKLLAFLAGKLTRPVLVTSLWLLCLVSTGAFEYDIWPQAFNYSGLLQQAQAWFRQVLGLELAPWHFLVLCSLVFVVAFDKVVALVWHAFPWPLSWSTADFWRASKSWRAPLRLSAVLELSDSLTLSEIETQMMKAESILKTEHAESYAGHFDSLSGRFRLYASYYTAIGVVALLTALLILPAHFIRNSPLLASGLAQSTAILFAIAILLRIACELLCERIAWERPFFVLGYEDRNYGQLAKLAEAKPAITRALFGELVHPTVPGFPYGRFWLLHFLRQVPGFSRLGEFGWRPESVLRNEFPGFYEENDLTSSKIKSGMGPAGIHQWLVAVTLRSLVNLGLVENGSA